MHYLFFLQYEEEHSPPGVKLLYHIEITMGRLLMILRYDNSLNLYSDSVILQTEKNPCFVKQLKETLLCKIK